MLLQAQVTEQWAGFAFSDVGTAAAGRYFDIQLKGLTDPLLIDHLLQYYGNYTQLHIAALPAYQVWLQAQLRPAITHLTAQLGAVPIELREIINDYLACEGRYTYAALVYYRAFVLELAGRSLTEETLCRLLEKLEFNHLGFLDYLQDRVGPEDLPRLLVLAGRDVKPYHPDWAPLTRLLADWLKESAPQTVKIPLTLSVAQLACLIWAFNAEGVFGAIELQPLFRLVTRCFRTKKQSEVSDHSLSKSYYGISQKTAAVVRDLCLRLAARITRQFFPA